MVLAKYKKIRSNKGHRPQKALPKPGSVSGLNQEIKPNRDPQQSKEALNGERQKATQLGGNGEHSSRPSKKGQRKVS
jgi:hypothetical protein